MHDKNGTPIHEGDYVKLSTYVDGAPKIVIAQVLKCKADAETCNLYVGVPYRTLAIREEYATAGSVEVVPVE